MPTILRQGSWDCGISKMIHNFVMRLFQAIRDFFSPSQVPQRSEPRVGGDLCAFYLGRMQCGNGSSWEEIINWDNQRLESQHDYIQWLFPLKTRSGPNPSAPILNADTIQVFKQSPKGQARLLRSFDRMLSFYGLQRNAQRGEITRSANFNTRAAVWLTQNNHNFLRITRIIHSLYLLGQPNQSQSFFTVMQDIYNNEGRGIIGLETLNHWQRACS